MKCLPEFREQPLDLRPIFRNNAFSSQTSDQDADLPTHARFIRVLLFLAALVLGAGSAAAQPGVDALKKRLDDAMPGTVIELPPSSLKLIRPLVITRSGSEAEPIILRARERGKTIFDGKAGIEIIGASHVVIEGFSFFTKAKRQRSD